MRGATGIRAGDASRGRGGPVGGILWRTDGPNRWPEDAGRDAIGGGVDFLHGSTEVAYEYDGEVVISSFGRIGQMLREPSNQR